MIRPKSTMRRVLAATAGAALATVGALAFASSPASAHAGGLDAGYQCVNGEWVVTWTVVNDMPSKEATVTYVRLQPQNATVSNIAVGSKVPVATWKNHRLELGRLVGETKVSVGTPWVELKVKLDWPQHQGNPQYTKKVHLTGPCTTPTTPPATPTPEPTEEPTPTPEPTTPEPTTPAPTTPAPSATPTPVPTGEPTGTDRSTCDELIIEISNPEDGPEFTIVFTPNTGEPQTVTVKPGDQNVTVKFPGSEGLEVVPSMGDVQGEPIKWTKPGNCTPGGGGGEGDLPLTGAAAGGIAAGAVLLLGAGVVLYIVARRRRVTFTA